MSVYDKIDNLSQDYYSEVTCYDKDGNLDFCKPKKKSIEVKSGKHTFTVVAQLSRYITMIAKQYLPYFGDEEDVYCNYFDPIDSATRVSCELESDSSRYADYEERIDAISTVPIGTKGLGKETVKNRVFFFLKMCHRCLDNNVLTYIAAVAPKKKDGTFKKNGRTRITTLLCVDFCNDTYALTAVPKTDTELEIKIVKEKFTPKSLEYLKDDLVSRTDMLCNFNNEEEEEAPSQKFLLLLDGMELEVPYLVLDNGEIAIDAKPYRSIESFDFVKKIGANKYSFELPIIQSGIVDGANISHDVKFFHNKCYNYYRYLIAAEKYIYSKSKSGNVLKQLNDAQHNFMSWRYDKKVRDSIYRSEQFISESVYLMLVDFEYANNQLMNDLPAAIQKMYATKQPGERSRPKLYEPLGIVARRCPAFKCYLNLYERPSHEIDLRLDIGMHDKWTLN